MIYVGNKSGKAREIKSIKTGVNGIAKNIANGWIGENGVAKRIYSQGQNAFIVTASGYMKVELEGINVVLDWGDDSPVERPYNKVRETYEHTYEDDKPRHLVIKGKLSALVFNGSTGLLAVESPLPTTLKSYNGMFQGCSSLIVAPDLPVETPNAYVPGQYRGMFSDCTSLTVPPALPAITLPMYAYHNMFMNCTSLKVPPALPATKLAHMCYTWMFYGCTSLEALPELPATQLESMCYDQMFCGCEKIKLSTTQKSDYQTPYRIPSNGDGTDRSDSLHLMFDLTGGTFTGTPTINTTYYTSNTVIPAT